MSVLLKAGTGHIYLLRQADDHSLW